MSTSSTLRALLATAIAATPFVFAADAHAHHPARSASPWGEASLAIKAGGYDMSELEPGRDSFDGLFLGAEWGEAPSRHVAFGLTADWFHRRRGEEEVLLIDTPYELPVHGVVELQGTSTDLVPVGGKLCIRFPIKNGGLVPFIAGQLTYDVLRLAYREVETSAGSESVGEQDDFFHGMGKGLSAGIEARLDDSFDLLVELGLHESKPGKSMTIRDVPLRGEVDAGGGYARVGMRFTLP